MVMRALLAIVITQCSVLAAFGQSVITTVAGGGPAPLSQATNVAFNSPAGIVADGNGNIYVSNFLHHQIFKVSLGTGDLTVVAGTGLLGFSGDGGPATDAQLFQPKGLALDGAGNLLVADSANQRIRRISASTGIITTIAGTGGIGFAGEGGSPLSAQFRSPPGVAVDSAGHIYIADQGNNRVRKIIAGLGVIVTVAGNGTAGFSGDGGSATSAQLRFPNAVAVDASGVLYIADTRSHRVRRVGTNGIITTAVGIGVPGFAGDGGAATSARINEPSDVAIDASGSLFVMDLSNHRVRKVANGIISTFAGTGVVGFSGDGGPATSAAFNFPQNVAIQAGGAVFVTDFSNRRVRCIVPTGVVTTVAGNGLTSHGGDGGLATSAQLTPSGVAFDSAGHMFVSDSNGTIRRVDASTGIISMFAGVPEQTLYNGDGIPATSAHMTPSATVFDAAGNLYLTDHDRVRRISAATGLISTVAGTGIPGFSGDGGLAVNARLQVPRGLALDHAGNLYISEHENEVVRRVSAATGIITTVAGMAGLFGFAGDGGPATSARLHRPRGLAVDAAGNLYIADMQNDRIRRVSAQSGIIQTVAGSGIRSFGGDGGVATGAHLFNPEDVALDAAGTMYISDGGNHRVRAVSAGIITTVAGAGPRGFAGDGGPATAALLANPQGIEVDSLGRAHIVDRGNLRIRRVNSANPAPTADAGADQTIEATAPATAVQLDGSGSSDPEGESITYEWRDSSNLLVSTTAVASLSPALGAHTFTLTVRDARGATHDDTVTVLVRDTMGPRITFVAPSVGPYALLDVILASYSCVDAVSGVSSCAGTVATGVAVDTATAGSRTFTVQAEDLLGNVSSISFDYTVTPGVPSIQWTPATPITVGTVLGGAHLNAAAVYRGVAVAGTFAYSPGTGTLLSVGVHALGATFTAGDQVNYVGATAGVQVTVAYGVRVLVDESRAHRAGSTVPVKLQLCDATGANVSSPAVTVTARALVRISDSASSDVQDAGHANPEGGFRYQSPGGSGGEYIFNLQAQGLPAGTYRLDFTASGDLTMHSMLLQLR